MNSGFSQRSAMPVLTASSFHQPEYIVESAWLEHAPFMFWLIDAQRPARFVELGCHRGYSYFTVCEAVNRLGIPAACFAVDTWQGDEQAGFYGEEVFEAVSVHNATHYWAFSQLIRASFKDAVCLFPDGSIDLLHIDGRHYYEDVLEDLTTWRPKLAAESIVLLHDSNVRERQFGVWKLFDELRQQHPTYEFVHGHGLGVVAINRIPSPLKSLFEASDDQRAFLQVAYSTLGGAISQRWQLMQYAAETRHREIAHAEELARLSAAWKEQKSLQAQLSERDAEIIDLRASVEHLKEQRRDAALREQELRDCIAMHARVDAQHGKNYAESVELLIQAQGDVGQKVASLQAEITRLRDDRVRRKGWGPRQVIKRLRGSSHQSQSIVRRDVSLACLVGWLLTFRFRQVAEGWRALARLRRDEAILAADPMFDADYYRQTNPRASAKGWSPQRHYLTRGRFKNRDPHPLFDMRWYLQEYRDVAAAGVDPLLHYIRFGRAEGRRPNAFFDTGWYRERYPEVTALGVDPVQHYLQNGAAKGCNPSPNFNTNWYIQQYEDVGRSGVNPLVHYLQQGMREGREIADFSVVDRSVAPVTSAAIDCRKQPSSHSEVALFVTHSPNGRLKPHVRHYLESLDREGIGIILIVAADQGFTEDDPWLYDLLDGLYVRANAGWDFACWAHVLRLNRKLYRSNILYWLNDSLIGPVNQEAFHGLIGRVRKTSAGLVGLTVNYERGRHIQSYFLAFKQEALTSFAFHEFVLRVRSLADKDDVINAYEIKLSPKLEAAGVSTASIFEPKSIHNPTLFHWRELLEEGFPFLKVLAVTGDVKQIDNTGWREALQNRGYDVRLADQVLFERRNPPVNLSLSPSVEKSPAPPPTNQPPQVTFIGPWNYGNGLGVAARGYVSALMHIGLPLNILPIERPFHIHERTAPTLRSTEFVGVPDVAVVHVNPEGWGPLLTYDQGETVSNARRRIGAFIWESQKLPDIFGERMLGLDAVWAPSQFCAAGFKRVSDIPVDVVHYPVPVSPCFADSAQIAQVKREVGLEEESKIILFMFDASSYLARKNPLALVRAFDRSGLAAKGWRLVLKTKHLSRGKPDAQSLVHAAESASGVAILNRAIGLDAARTLMQAADIYASPHASEGFGLTIAEAMAQGKAVIATDYGGSTDFLDASCGFPVPCQPWQLDHDEGVYQRGTVWSRPDDDAFTEILVTVAGLSSAERAAVGARARQRIASRLSPAAVALQMRASIDSLLAR